MTWTANVNDVKLTEHNVGYRQELPIFQKFWQYLVLLHELGLYVHVVHEG